MKKIILNIIMNLLLIIIFLFTSCTIEQDSHLHTFEQVLSYDEEYHFYYSTCEHQLIKGKTFHTFKEEIIVDATENDEGIKKLQCIYCQYYKTISIPKKTHQHTFEQEYRYDEFEHYIISTCDHNLKKDQEKHLFDTGVIIKEPTYQEQGIKKYSCKVCKYYKEEKINFESEPCLGKGTNESPYLIYNVQNLMWFRDLVNQGNEKADAILLNDIVLNENLDINEDLIYHWIPIGNTKIRYQGNFNGNNYHIKGLYINDQQLEYTGLFGRLYNGKIENLHLTNSKVSGKQFVGGIVGDNTGSVVNSSFDGIVEGTFEGVGGICGANFNIIKNCKTKGEIKGLSTIIDSKTIYCVALGGICGANYGTIENAINQSQINGSSMIGGITGINNGKIQNIINQGNITGDDTNVYAYLGGICGYATILSSVNKAKNYNNISSNKYYVGGIIGYTEASGTSQNTECINLGNITGLMYVGGIIGYNFQMIKNCYNQGIIKGSKYIGGIAGMNRHSKKTSGQISFTYNIGEIISTTNDYTECGAITGYNKDGTIQNSFYLDNLKSNNIGTKKSIEEFKNGQVKELLNNALENKIWKQLLDKDDFPYFDDPNINLKNQN